MTFHDKLSQYLRNKERGNATMIVLHELAICLMRDRSSFLHILQSSGVNVKDDATDVELINAFVSQAPKNKRLLLGASFLINHSNKVAGFDGEEEVSDAGVKNTYGVLKSYFNGQPMQEEDYSNWLGAVLGVGKALVGGLQKNKGEKATAPTPPSNENVIKQLTAQLEMQMKITEQKKREVAKLEKAKERAEKKTKTIMIVGGVVVGVLVLALIIYSQKR